jgi:hypothetical protein
MSFLTPTSPPIMAECREWISLGVPERDPTKLFRLTGNVTCLLCFIIRPKKSCHGPKTAMSLRSTSTARGSKSLDSTEIKVRSLSDLKSKHNRQVTFPVKRNNLVGSLSGTPKEIHSRHSAIIAILSEHWQLFFTLCRIKSFKYSLSCKETLIVIHVYM